MDAFDADVLIYSAVPGHPLGEPVAELFRQVHGQFAGVGSVLLIPEVLGKPLRDGEVAEVRVLAGLLARLDLRPVDRATAELATALSVKYGLRAVDAAHLATAVAIGADRFLTNNQRDFPQAISELRVTYPADLRVGMAERGNTYRATVGVQPARLKLVDTRGRAHASHGENYDAD